MSVDLMTLGWRTELQAGPRLVLLAICDNANDEGSCYPSISTIALKCGLSVRAVRGHVAALGEQNLLVRNERPGQSTEYQINFAGLRMAVYLSLSKRKFLSEFDKVILKACTPDGIQPTPAESAPRQNLPTQPTPAESAYHPGRICLPPRQNLPTTPAESAAITIKEPSINTSNTKKKIKKKVKVVATSTFVLPDWINKTHWDAWHSCTKRRGVTDSQKELAIEKLAKWRDQGKDFAAALEDAAIGGWQGLFEPKPPAAPPPPAGGHHRHAAAGATIFDGVWDQ